MLLFRTGHGVNLCRIVKRTVDIVYTKAEGQLRSFPAYHCPIGLDMWEIIEVNATNGIVAEILYDGRLRHMGHLVILVTEFQWNEGLEAVRSVLQLPQSFHVVHAMPIFLDMAIQHGRIRMHAQLMPFFVDLQPLFGIAFILRNL